MTTNPYALPLAAALFAACGGSTPAPAASEAAPPGPASRPAAPAPTAPVGPSASAEAAPAAAVATPPATADEAVAAAPATLPAGTTVLQVGDSFAGSLAVPMRPILEAAGLRFILEFKDASYIPTWANPKTGLARLIARKDPDLVLIVLGANELEMPNPSLHLGAIRRLIGEVGDRPCVWVAPTIEPGTGILKLVQENLGHCRYFDSYARVPDVPRLKDNIHPTDSGRQRWARSLVDWLAAERDPDGPRPWSFRP